MPTPRASVSRSRTPPRPATLVVNNATSTRQKHRITRLPLTVSVVAFLAVIALTIGGLTAQWMAREDHALRSDIAWNEMRLLDRIIQLEQSVLCGNLTTPGTMTTTAAKLSQANVKIDTATWNVAAANESIEYRNTKQGVVLRLPYNSAWGNSSYRIEPFETDGDVIRFGRLLRDQSPDSRGYFREFSLLLTAPESLEQMRNKVGQSARFEAISASGFPVYRMLAANSNGQEALVFTGKRYSYYFTQRTAESATVKAPATETVLPILRSLRSI